MHWYKLRPVGPSHTYRTLHAVCDNGSIQSSYYCVEYTVQFNFITLPCSILIFNYVFAHWIFLVMRNRRNWIFKSHSESPWVNKFCFDSAAFGQQRILLLICKERFFNSNNKITNVYFKLFYLCWRSKIKSVQYKINITRDDIQRDKNKEK